MRRSRYTPRLEACEARILCDAADDGGTDAPPGDLAGPVADLVTGAYAGAVGTDPDTAGFEAIARAGDAIAADQFWADQVQATLAPPPPMLP